jgi:hypothetical protein
MENAYVPPGIRQLHRPGPLLAACTGRPQYFLVGPPTLALSSPLLTSRGLDNYVFNLRPQSSCPFFPLVRERGSFLPRRLLLLLLGRHRRLGIRLLELARLRPPSP